METNVCILTGNVTRTPEAFATQSGQNKLSFGIAQNTRRRNASGEWEDGPTNFFDVVCWGNLANRVQQRVDKGTKVVVAGKLRTREYTDKEGRKRTAVEIVADEVEVIEVPRKRDYGQAQPMQAPAQPMPAQGYQEYVAQGMIDYADESIPF